MGARKSGFMPLTVILAAVLVLGACGNEDKSADPPPSGGDAQMNVPGPLGKYDPPIEVTTVRAVNQAFKYDPGKSINDNIWTDIFKEQYGITVKNLWAVDESQYRQKLNVSIASGDISDFMNVTKEEMTRMQKAGQLEDLTTLLDKYGSEYLKEMLKQDRGAALNAATFNGKLVGIPQMMVNGGVSTGSMIYVRDDWMKKLNLTEPKTIDDVIKIATAFVKNDPDGNGKQDTLGLGVNKDLYMGHGALTGFFSGYKAYPNMWVKDSSGKLVYGSILPEVKTALEQLSKLYKDGVIDKEFMVKPWSKLAEEIAADKLGIAYGTVSDAGHIQKANKDHNPNAEWRMYPIVSLDGAPAHPQLNDTAGNYYVVRKGAKHPEAMIKLANVYLEHFYLKSYAPDPNPFISRDGGIFPGKYHPVQIDPMSVNLDAFRQLQKALTNKDGSNLNFPANIHYERLIKFSQGDLTMWFSSAVFGPQGSYSVIDYYDKNGLGVYNQYQGAATPTMSDKLVSLQKIQDETFTKIIMGQAPITEFDKFVSDWKRLGGDAITKEVNEAAAAM